MTKPSKSSMKRASEIVCGDPRWTDKRTPVERIAKVLDDATEELGERCRELQIMNNLWQEERAHSAKLAGQLDFVSKQLDLALKQLDLANRKLEVMTAALDLIFVTPRPVAFAMHSEIANQALVRCKELENE